MTFSHLRLILVFPPDLESAVTDAMILCPGLPGFTLQHAEGHSSSFAHATAIERVRGRIERRVLWVVIEQAQLEQTLIWLKAHVPSREVRWWTEPVLQSGRLA